LKQLGLALHMYEGQYRVFPPGEIHGRAVDGSCPHCNWEGAIGMWMNLIFPMIDQQAAYMQLDFKIWPQYPSTANQTVMQMEFPTYLCPSDPYHGLTTGWGTGGNLNCSRILHYFAVDGSSENSLLGYPDGTSCGTYGHCNANDGMFYNDSAIRMADVTDGLSNTAMLCEVWGRSYVNAAPPSTPSPGPPTPWPAGESSRGMALHTAVYFDWTPNSNRTDPWKANGFHPGGVQIAFGDATVHFVPNTVDPHVFTAMSTRAGNETVSLGF
jgi:hypothetical protein